METSKTSTENPTQEKSTYSREDFLASPSLPMGEERERQMTATSGRKCLESYKKSSQHGSSLKTCVESLVSKGDWFSSQCALTWKPKVTTSNRLLFRLAAKTHPTGENEYGLLPTIGANESKGAGKKRYRGSPEYRGVKMSEGLRFSESDPIYTHPNFAEAAMGFPKDWTLVETP